MEDSVNAAIALMEDSLNAALALMEDQPRSDSSKETYQLFHYHFARNKRRKVFIVCHSIFWVLVYLLFYVITTNSVTSASRRVISKPLQLTVYISITPGDK